MTLSPSPEPNNLTLFKELLVTSFPENWWNTYNLKSDATSFNEFINKINKEAFDLLNKSILSGEYLIVNEFTTLVSEIRESVKNNAPSDLDDEVFQNAVQYYRDNFEKSLILALDVYLGLQKSIVNKLKFNSRIYVYNINTDVRDIFFGVKFDTSYLERIKFFQYNIIVTRHDHFMRVNGEDFAELEGVVHVLKRDFLSYEFAHSLVVKGNYLLAKYLLRMIEQNKVNSENLFVIKNFVETRVNIGEFEDESYKEQIKYIRSHYEIDEDWRLNLSDEVEEFKDKPISGLSLKELHGLIKYNKDIKKTISGLSKIREEIEKRYETLKAFEKPNLFNLCSYKVVLNYAYNNEFSLLLEQHDNEADFEMIDDFHKKIINVQNDTEVKNFFPQLKYLEYLKRRLESLKSTKQAFFDNISKTKIYLEKSEELIGRYEECVKWTDINYNYLFMEQVDDCFLELKSSQLRRVFISSTFLLPIKRDKMKQDFEQLKQYVFAIKESVTIFENVEDGLVKIKDNVDTGLQKSKELEKELSKTSNRTIEIVGLFTAIVTFIVGSLPSFKFIDSAYEAILFTVAIGSTLSFFILNTLIVSRGYRRTVGENSRFVIAHLVLVIIAWIIIIVYGIVVDTSSCKAKDEASSEKISTEIEIVNGNVIESKSYNGKK